MEADTVVNGVDTIELAVDPMDIAIDPVVEPVDSDEVGVDPLENGDSGVKILEPKKKPNLFSFETEKEDLFSLNGLGKKVINEGRLVQRHPNGKVNIASMVNDPEALTNICPYCKLTFVHKFVLARHIKQMHEKHKLVNYQCPKCEYSTVRKDQMRSHFSVVHENFKPFSCSLCGFKAPRSFRVTAHLQKAHNGEGAVIHDTNMKPQSVSPPPQPQRQQPNTFQLIQNPGFKGTNRFMSGGVALTGLQGGRLETTQTIKTYNLQDGSSTLPAVQLQPVTNFEPSVGVITTTQSANVLQLGQTLVTQPPPPPPPAPLPLPILNVNITEVNPKPAAPTPPPPPPPDPRIERRPFPCPYCSFSSKSQILIGDHIFVTHSDKNPDVQAETWQKPSKGELRPPK